MAMSRYFAWRGQRHAFMLLASWLAVLSSARAGAADFADQGNVFTAHTITSAPLAAEGLSGAAGVTVSGGSYSIGCVDPFVTTPGTIVNGQTVCVRHQSASEPARANRTVLTIGGVEHAFLSITAPDRESALIAGYYRSILGRDADPGGLGFWNARSADVEDFGLNPNETWRALAVAFFQSAEYRAANASGTDFIVDLYNTFFERSPDAGGLAFWQGQIASGMSRDMVLLWFLFSAEFEAHNAAIFGNGGSRAEVGMVADMYRGLLNRLPDKDGFTYWSARMRSAQCAGAAEVLAEVDALSGGFLASAEYAGRARTNAEFVSDLYNAFLRRGGDLQGLRFWVDRLGGGSLARAEVLEAFKRSAEFQGRVADVVAQGCSTLADTSSLVVSLTGVAPSPFIALAGIQGSNLDRVSTVAFTIQTKTGRMSRPVHVAYSNAYLAATGHGLRSTVYEFPIFGLYAGYPNLVAVDVRFDDGSVKQMTLPVTTPAFNDPAHVFDAMRVVSPRTAEPLAFDFMYLKSRVGGPLVMDTDGEVRWWQPGVPNGFSSTFFANRFVIGDSDSMHWRNLLLDGTATDTVIPGYANFHHNANPGKHGVLVQVDVQDGTVLELEQTLLELDASGAVIRRWNLDEILSAFMRARGDDPSTLVRPGVDWCHMNDALYDARDDSLLVSCRELFVLKLDYETGAIQWLLGDPTKHWHAFPSLAAISVSLDAGLVPVGQHGISLTSAGQLLLFNNGTASLNPPPGGARGESRSYSALSAYSIDAQHLRGAEIYDFDNGRSIFSPFCSSVYQSGDSLLVSYAYADGGAHARLLGLSGARHVAFDYELPSAACSAAWNVIPIAFESLRLR